MKKYDSLVFLLLANAALFWGCETIPWTVWNYHACWKGDSTYCYEHKGETPYGSLSDNEEPLHALTLLCQHKFSPEKPAFEKVCDSLTSYTIERMHNYVSWREKPLPPKIADEFVIDVNIRTENRRASLYVFPK